MAGDTVKAEKTRGLKNGWVVRIQTVEYYFNGQKIIKSLFCLLKNGVITAARWESPKKLERDGEKICDWVNRIILDISGCQAPSV